MDRNWIPSPKDLGPDPEPRVYTAPKPPPKEIEQACGTLRRGGTLVFIALPADNEVKLPIFETVLNGITIVGSIVGTRSDLRDTGALP